MTRRTVREDAPEAAGAKYAQEQLDGSYFMDWVREQLAEAAELPPDEVLPLETEADARVIAKNMLQQLEWDTKRGLEPREIANLIGTDATSHDDVKEFFGGFSDTLRMNNAWLAEELLALKGEMRGGVSEARRDKRPIGYKPTFKKWLQEVDQALFISHRELIKDYPSAHASLAKWWADGVGPHEAGERLHSRREASGASEARRRSPTPRQIQDFRNGFTEGYREGKHGETKVDGRPPSPEYAEGTRRGLLAGAHYYPGDNSTGIIDGAVASWIENDQPGGVNEASRRTGGTRGGPAQVREGGKQATKPGKHGTLRLWRIVYKDSGDSAFGEDSFQKWAYDKQAAWEAFNEQTNAESESWEIVRIEPVLDTGPRRIGREGARRAMHARNPTPVDEEARRRPKARGSARRHR